MPDGLLPASCTSVLPLPATSLVHAVLVYTALVMDCTAALLVPELHVAPWSAEDAENRRA